MLKSFKFMLMSSAATAIVCASAGLTPVRADDAAPAADPSAIKFTGLVEAGITGTPTTKGNDVNFAHAFTDKTDQVLLNQVALTLNKDLDPKAEGFDWGFKLQGFYGSDARYTHTIGVFDHASKDRNQFDIVESSLAAHVPVLTEGGIDAKVGTYLTPIGAEVIAGNGNYLYSHSYIFNFGTPFKHTGGYLTTHANATIDVITGADTGWNESIGSGGTVNSGGPSSLAGLGFNGLLDGKLTVLALSHIGSQYPSTGPNGSPKGNNHARQTYDIVATYKASDSLTFVTELDYVREDANRAPAYAMAQYGVYTVNSTVSLVARGEVFADPQNYYVAAYPGNRDPVNAERGLAYDQSPVTANTGSTYGEVTLGLTYTPEGLPAIITGAMIRPEIRFDSTLDGVRAYDGGRKENQIGAGVDVVVPINFL